MNKPADFWIKTLNLSPHPEGGYFKETFRASEIIKKEHLPPRYSGPRPISTSIYFLLKGAEFSAFHRLKSDEIWHFYEGSSLTLYILEQQGTLSQLKLGPQAEQGEQFQAIIKAGNWFGATVDNLSSFSLVGCDVAFGFDFADFEVAERQALTRQYPQHSTIIEKLTKE